MKYQTELQKDTNTTSPEIRAAFDQYRLAFYRLAVKELEGQGEIDNHPSDSEEIRANHLIVAFPP